MNEKESNIYRILDIVVSECTIESSGIVTVTTEDVLGKSRKENVVMTRCIFVTEMLFMGYSVTTIASILNRSAQAVSNILVSAHQYRVKSWVYRQAEAKSTLRCKEIMGE